MSAVRDAKGRLYLVGAPCAPVVTLFKDNKAFHIDDVREMDLTEVERVIRSAAPATDKDHLRMIKFATFGEKRSASGALRHDANVTSVTGLEGDYDDLLMDMEEAIEILRSRNIKALFNTSANYEPQEPKWHVFCPLSEPLKGDEKHLRKQRRHWVGVLNAVLDGVLTEESFVLSQCFYFGPVQGRDEPLIAQVDGLCIDQVEGLPAPEFPAETQGDPKSEAKWVQDFGNGVRKFFSLRSLTWEWAQQGQTVESMCQRVDALCDKYPQSSRTQKGRDLRKAGMKLAESAWTKVREKGGPRKQQKVEEPKPVEPFPTSLAVPVATFNALDIPARTHIVKDLLLTQTLSMIYAARGVGKTMLALDLAVRVARGHTQFLEWSVGDGCRVLYVDGEMAASELQERLRKFCGNDVPERLDILSSESFYGTEDASLNLANIVHQERFTLMLDALTAEGRAPALIILDNKSALTGGTDENSNSEQDGFLIFLRVLRHRGYAVMFIHHAGKSGDQRGASRNEDFLDLVIRLEVPKADEKDGASMPMTRGAAFKMSFTKHRGLRPDPATLHLELGEDEDQWFEWFMTKPGRKPQWLIVAEYIYDHAPTKQVDIATALNINAGNLSKAIKYLRDDRKMIDPKSLRLTPSGRAYIDEVRSNRSANDDAN